MNFNYSYRAFLISSLLVGNIILFFNIIKISRYQEVEEELVGVEYLPEEILLEEEELAIATPQDAKVETHRAFNEAEKFIKEAETEREDISEEMETKLAEMKEAIDNGSDPFEIPELSEDALSELDTKKKTKRGANRNSTNSYSLKGRDAMFLPNPVYTCEGFGKVVISIEVSATGKVVKANFNKKLSSTTNQCLIDQALEYAKISRFSTDASQLEQLGTITYNFPGQR